MSSVKAQHTYCIHISHQLLAQLKRKSGDYLRVSVGEPRPVSRKILRGEKSSRKVADDVVRRREPAVILLHEIRIPNYPISTKRVWDR